MKTKMINRWLAVGVILAAVLFIAAKPSTKNMELTTSESSGVITIVRITDTGMGTRIGESAEYEIKIDGNTVDTISKSQRMKVAVPNGEHAILLTQRGGRLSSNEIKFNVDSDENLFHVYIEGVRGEMVLVHMNKL